MNINAKFLPNVPVGTYTVNTDQSAYQVRGAITRAIHAKIAAYLRSIGVVGIVTVVVGALAVGKVGITRYVRITRGNAANLVNQAANVRYVARVIAQFAKVGIALV